MKTIHCPVCKKDVEPFVFQLWDGLHVNVCPDCRIGIGNIDKVVKSGRDKMIRSPEVSKSTHGRPKSGKRSSYRTRPE